jgi:uncharacterized membrane-anchored protein
VDSLKMKLFGRKLLNKVPEITIYFWIIKIMGTTVGETFADFLTSNLGLGLLHTAYLMSVALIIVLLIQFKVKKYVPGIYWLTVVLISTVGTLITDNLSDNFGVPLFTSTIVFSLALALTFGIWYKNERTLSIHAVTTTKREGFYWLAILFTFALGTAAGDLIAEQYNLGYPLSVALFGALIALVTGAHYWLRAHMAADHKRLGANAVLAFWIAYILTRPFGASIGDLLSQPRNIGGWGLGTTSTSLIFLGLIAALVVYLSVSRKDAIRKVF